MFIRIAALGGAAILAMASLSGQNSGTNLRLGALWMDQYPVVNATMECIPSEDASQPCEPPKDLWLVEDGATTSSTTHVIPLSDTKIGMAIVIALDVSGSMRGRPMLAIRRALASFAARARPWDKIAVVTFADDVREDLPFGSDRLALAKALQSLQTRCCNTHLYDALSESIDLLNANDLPPVRRVTVISDGKDEGSRTTQDDVVKRAEATHITIDAIGVSRIEPAYLQSLETIASRTRGVFRRADSDQALERLVASGIDQMLAARVASFQLSHITPDGGIHTVGVAAPSVSWSEDRPLQMPKSSLASPQPSEWYTRPAILIAAAILLLGGSVVLIILLRRRHATVLASARARAVNQSSPPRQQELARRDPSPINRVPPAEADAGGLAAVRVRPRRQTVMLHRFEEPRPDRPSAWLSQTSGAGEHFVYALIKSPTWLGTASSATIQLDTIHDVLPMHAYIEFEDGSLYLRSDSPDARVTVEGEEFSAGRRLVLPGNVFQVGNVSFRMDLSRPVID